MEDNKVPRARLPLIARSHAMLFKDRPDENRALMLSGFWSRPYCYTSLPDLTEFRPDADTEVHDKDSERKAKGSMYADARRKAKPSDIAQGDEVLVKQRKGNKLSTTFNPNPMKVLSKSGNSVVIKSNQGVVYQRNVHHLKKFYRKENSQEVDMSE